MKQFGKYAFMSKTVLFFHIVNSIHQKTNLSILFYRLNLDMHGPIMRPDFHEEFLSAGLSRKFIFLKIVNLVQTLSSWTPNKGPATVSLMPTEGDRVQLRSKVRRQSSILSPKDGEGGSSCSRQMLSLGSVLGFWPAGKGVGALTGLSRCSSVSLAGHHITVLVAHCHHLELRCYEQHLRTCPVS